MSTMQDTAFDIETWRDATIAQILDGDIEGPGGYARIAHAMHDIRIRDVICYHAVNGNSRYIKSIALLSAAEVPVKERADAYAIAAICNAIDGREGMAREFSQLAFKSNNDHSLSRLLIMTWLVGRNRLTDAVPEIFRKLSLDQCRNGNN